MLKSFHPCFKLGLDLSHQRASLDQPEADACQTAEEKASALRKHRKDFLKKMTAAEHAVMARWGPEAAGAARRMVTVWLDEILIEAPWPGREDWLRKPLQSQWGEGRSGGLWFFRKLEELNPARQDDRELAALALRCISLGLTGSYGRDPDGLGEVRRRIQARFDFKDDTPVFPPPLPPGRKGKILNSSGRRLLAVLLLVPLLFWIVSGLSLNRSFRAILNNADQAAFEARSSSGRLAAPSSPPARPVKPGEKL